MITELVAKALGMAQIFDLIDARGDFCEGIRRAIARMQPDENASYAITGRLMQRFEGDKATLEALQEALEHLTKTPWNVINSMEPLSLHEVFLLKEFIWAYQKVRAFSVHNALDKVAKLPDLSVLFRYLDPDGAGLPVFYLSAAYSQAIKRLQGRKETLLEKAKQQERAHLEAAKWELGIPGLKREFILSRAQKELCDKVIRSGYFIISAESVANYSFRLTEDAELLAIHARLATLQVELEKEEQRVLALISKRIQDAKALLNRAVTAMTAFARAVMLADFGIRFDCCIPKLGKSKRMAFAQARNLPLQMHLEAQGRRYQSLDIDFKHRINLITGPNMGGKTSVLKLIGQFCVLARLGIPLPCASAQMTYVDHIWYNQDDPDDSADLSTFGREVVSLNAALAKPGKLLLLLDEFAKGTNPVEGEGLVCAVLEYLAGTEHLCVAATHFTAPALQRNLARYSSGGIDPDSTALRTAVELEPQERLKLLGNAMDYSLRPLRRHQAPPRCAVGIARVLGLPEDILRLLPPSTEHNSEDQ